LSQLLSSPLEKKHLELGARLVGFGGWNMPVSYAGIIQEHHHTREKASLFDICHMGEFRLVGKGLAEQMDTIFARPSSNLAIGSCRYNFLLRDDGGILDDLIIYRISEEEFYIVVNVATKDNDAQVIKSRLKSEYSFQDESQQTAKIDLQGPWTQKALNDLGILNKDLPSYYRWKHLVINGIDVLVSRTGYTGEQGYEFYLPSKNVEFLWDLLLSVSFVMPAGLGARDTLRLEMGYPLYGHEMNEEVNPLESGFERMLKPRTGFVGDVIYEKPPLQKLVALEIEGRRAVRQGAKVFNENGDEVGVVTSGSFSPSLEKVIALAFIKDSYIGDTTFIIPIRRHSLVASVVKLPFYKGGSLRV